MKRAIKRTGQLKNKITRMRLVYNMSLDAMAKETCFSSSFIREYCIENGIGLRPNSILEKEPARSTKYKAILEEPLNPGKSYKQILKEKGLRINNEGYGIKIKKST